MKGGAPVPQAAFGPYKILTLLGQGGGGAVYRAWDPRLEREVALKLISEPRSNDSKRAERFVAEARAASALNHPNIVTVLDAAFDSGTPYIVSELIDGHTLREEMVRGPLPPRRLLDLATQIADGLSAAHDAAIIHRDIKPENIMVTRTGRLKIVDFGLASPGTPEPPGAESTQDDVQTRTDFGLRVGTIAYMSPEQARGAAVDFRTDQFSLGLVLFEMAAGRHAFKRDTPAATLDAIINDEPLNLSALDARLPPLFRWIVERCLTKDPQERYAVTSDLHRDLKMFRDRFNEQVPSPSGPTAPARLPWQRGLVATAVIAAFVAGAILSMLVPKACNTDTGALKFAPFTTDPGYQGFPAWSPDGQTRA